VKKILYVFIVIVFLFFVGRGFYSLRRTLLPEDKLQILLLYNPSLAKKHISIINAYKSVLEEEGVSYKFVTSYSVLSQKFEKLLKRNPVIIIPDVVAQNLPEDTALWFRNYLANGGTVFIVYDGGVKNQRGAFLDRAIFSGLIGVNYITYKNFKGDAYTTGNVQFNNAESAAFFEIPPGKMDRELFLIGYSYGRLKYPIARTRYTGKLNKGELYAYGVTKENKKYPVLIVKKYGKGTICYSNLPLGYLKAFGSDDLLLRACLRTVLFKIARIPHLLNTHYGKGGIVFNWHLDDYREIENTLFMIKNGYFRKGLKYSIHITAGDFNNKPGDKRGFDAENKGKDTVKLLLPYGTIGSHGGWGHNWFAYNTETGNFGKIEIEEYIKKNTECLENITGYKIIEYSAPAGIHPQPENTEILEKFGFNSYYFTGDSSSAPNRTFANGKMVSKNVIGFPVTALAEMASFQEMGKKKISPGEFQNWLFSILNYTVENRTVRFLYSHLYDLLDFPQYLPPRIICL